MVPGRKMRQQRHTTAYAASWQASGNRAAPHWHPSEINAPDNGTAAGLHMLLAAAVPGTGRL